MKSTMFGMPKDAPNKSALDDSVEERQKIYEEAWKKGGFY